MAGSYDWGFPPGATDALFPVSPPGALTQIDAPAEE